MNCINKVHLFNVEVAQKYELLESVFVYNLQFDILT